MTTDINYSLLRLLQLSSATLPVGGYAFSQGLELAIEESWLDDAIGVEQWLNEQLMASFSRLDLAIFIRQFNALKNGDRRCFSDWNRYLLASRESKELRLTDTAMGSALEKLLFELSVDLTGLATQEMTFLSAFAAAAVEWHIPLDDACYGLSWSWCENQVAGASKLLPMGQTAAQQLLTRLLESIPLAVEQAKGIDDASIGQSMPALAIASCLHEVQRTRLFRS